MSEEPTVVEKRIRLSSARAERLTQFAEARALSEDEIVEKALDILFSLTALLDEGAERRGWSVLSENSLTRVWDNEQDARYDNWKGVVYD